VGNQLANYTVALITPVLISTSMFGAYYFFAICTFLCTLLCAFCMVETKGHSLEAIEARYLETRAKKAAGNGGIAGFRLRRIQGSQV